MNLNSLSLPSKSSRLSSLAPLAPLNSHRAHGKPASAAPVSLARPAAKEEEAFEVEADESDAEDYDDAFDVDIEDETEGELNASSISANTLDIIIGNVEIVEACDGCVAKINRQVTPSEVAAG